ncbi:hypothetical protein GCM10027062_28850 [Nocardioides hungaricus]
MAVVPEPTQQNGLTEKHLVPHQGHWVAIAQGGQAEEVGQRVERSGSDDAVEPRQPRRPAGRDLVELEEVCVADVLGGRRLPSVIHGRSRIER